MNLFGVLSCEMILETKDLSGRKIGVLGGELNQQCNGEYPGELESTA